MAVDIRLPHFSLRVRALTRDELYSPCISQSGVSCGWSLALGNSPGNRIWTDLVLVHLSRPDASQNDFRTRKLSWALGSESDSMNRIVLEVFSEECNYGIVRMPGRSFPGCVVQGDSLSILLRCAERAHAMACQTGNVDLIDEVEGLKESLADRLQHYERVLKAHGMDLPYFRPSAGH